MTAVEWLAEQMMHPQIHNPYIEQAKEMEREQIVNAFCQGDNTDCLSEQNIKETFRKNETFKKQDNDK